MFWARRGKTVRSSRVNSYHSKSVRAAARLTVEALETRRLFAYALTSVPIDNAPPQNTMAAEGDLVLVGQPGHGGYVGQVSVVDAQTGQALTPPIANPDSNLYDNFGGDVAFIGGGRIAVGSFDSETGHGTVFIYDSISDSTPLPITGPSGGVLFGQRLEGLGADEVLISAATQSEVDQSGAVYVYNATTGAQIRTLTSGLAGANGDADGINDGGVANDQFGSAFAVQGTRILASSQTAAGEKYVAEIDAVTGQIVQKFDGEGNARFGENVEFAGSTAIIGDGAGQRVLQYDRADASLLETYSVPGTFSFGQYFDVEGDKLIVADPLANDGARIYGAAYIFDLDEDPSTLVTLDAPDKTTGAFGQFGTLVTALSGDRYAVLDVISDESGNPIDTNVRLFTPEVGNTNTAPTAEAGTYGAVDENSDILLDGGASSDLDGDALSYAWDLDNDGEYDDASTQTVIFTQDLPGTYTVGLKVTDNGGLTSTDTAVLTFNDVTPTANAGADQSGVRQQTLSYSGSGNNITGDAITSYEWNLDGDGLFDDASGANATFQYVTSGTVVVSLRVTDDDGQTAVDTATVTIVAAQLQGGDLIVGGTDAGESIEILRDNGSGPRVLFDGVLFGTFDVTGEVIVRGGAGNDTITSQLSNTFDTQIYGDAGNDTITGGGGGDFLFGGNDDDVLFARQGDDVALGGDGNDFIKGGGGRDILIGGLGSDDVEGNADDDILIAGYTSHDSDLAALGAIKAAWLSADDYATRVVTLRDGLLNNNTNVFDDSSIDTVRGGAGLDWFLVQETGSFVDVIQDLKKTEVSDDTVTL